MRKRQQSQNEGTPAVAQAPGNQRPNNTCCFCWCCCCSCSCLTVRNEERGENAGRPTLTTRMESIQVLEECQNPTADEVLSWSQNFDKMMKAPAGRNLFREFLRTEYSEENLLFWLACEDLKKEQNKKVIEEKARMIYEDYISILSPKEVNFWKTEVGSLRPRIALKEPQSKLGSAWDVDRSEDFSEQITELPNHAYS
ncbi:regulator of G-protein signaling 17 isoform X2 [Sciurus carolinensis]|uniref:regulator of G-protein signaling 17 isoform X2 n=1 Tax=Sciurus carolinensis TaxID=30640 RepID=UPI001FB1D077|nr:regulator of G-protein signaling 17 isoform X2 [Sciurus carolinensis]